MCRLRNIAMRDYQESVTTGQTHTQTDAEQSDPYVPLCLAGDTKTVTVKLPSIQIIRIHLITNPSTNFSP